ncbi:MAG TPA: hydantoinase/oxoprolinase family protein, partial [Candidatus Thermoplasmatota archaeon]|nr:hydantoinase/oxoprolinase family protein [Candidatus Thermoplasmatota archaeon]
MASAVAASDVGGTFTDLVLWDGRRLHTLKKVTDPKDRQRVVLDGTLELLRRAGLGPRHLVRVIHGTTAATNAVLQRKGGRVGLVTNEGFEDLIEIARQNRPRLYDLHAVRPEPLVPRNLRIGVAGRLDKDGRVLTPLDRGAVGRAAKRLRRAGVDSVAVCFLHSYRNPGPEAAAARTLSRAGLRRVSTSHEVAPEIREYERFTTTIMNAFLQPVFEDSLQRLEAGFARRGAKAPIFVIESSGGMVSVAEAQRTPVRAVLSGPAGGVAAASELARRLHVPNALTFDMGGTSTDMAILHDARPATRHEADVAGFPLRTPALDLTTIGAGGGSIARLDPGGILKVGPESAEAWPGPACYARGGKEPTVTDADVLLGRIDAKGFLVGSSEVRLASSLARLALTR